MQWDKVRLAAAVAIVLLWGYARQTRLQLLEAQQRHVRDLATLQGLVRDTQDHADLVVRLRCNASAIVDSHAMLSRQHEQRTAEVRALQAALDQCAMTVGHASSLVPPVYAQLPPPPAAADVARIAALEAELTHVRQQLAAAPPPAATLGFSEPPSSASFAGALVATAAAAAPALALAGLAAIGGGGEAAARAADGLLYLAIGIPTVPRTHNEVRSDEVSRKECLP